MKDTQDKTILVLGGTGKTGRRVLERLAHRGFPVRNGSRSGQPRFDWGDQNTWPSVLQNVESCLAKIGRPRSMTTVNMAKGFTAGWMALDFDVFNASTSVEQPNPSGLRVLINSATGSTTAAAVRKPATLALLAGCLLGLVSYGRRRKSRRRDSVGASVQKRLLEKLSRSICRIVVSVVSYSLLCVRCAGPSIHVARR